MADREPSRSWPTGRFEHARQSAGDLKHGCGRESLVPTGCKALNVLGSEPVQRDRRILEPVIAAGSGWARPGASQP